MTPTLTKSALRAQFRAFRDALSDKAYRTKSAAICRHVCTLATWEAADTVAAYWPQLGRREIDTRPLLQADERRTALPVVTSFPDDGGAPRMEHRLFTGEAQMTPNRWGILEPVNAPRVATDALGLVLVPALGADRNGHRIGHGAGYYDAFLTEVSAPTAALVYADCFVDTVPAEPHDVPVDIVVTERGIHRPTPSAHSFSR